MDIRYMFLNVYYTYILHISKSEIFLILIVSMMSYFLMKKCYRSNFRCFLMAALIGYYMFVVVITVFNRPYYNKFNYNFELFWSLREYLKTRSSLIAMEITQNIFMLVPVGICITIVESMNDIIPKVIIVSLLLSINIEFMQLILKKGMFEVDDVVYNVFGSVLASVICLIIKKYGRKKIE